MTIKALMLETAQNLKLMYVGFFQLINACIIHDMECSKANIVHMILALVTG